MTYRLPARAATIERRLLIDCRLDPAVASRLLPAGAASLDSVLVMRDVPITWTLPTGVLPSERMEHDSLATMAP